MRSEDVEYTVGSERYVGRLAVDESRPGPRPVVLVCHPGPGLDDLTHDRARRLADEGYLAMAVDYQGGGTSPGREAAMARLGELRKDRPRTAAVGRAALAAVLDRADGDPARVASLGFCFGGTMSFELARDGVDLLAAIGFHAGCPLPDLDAARRTTGAVLLLNGGNDPFVPAADRHAFEAELVEAGVTDWRFEVYGGVGHSYTEPAVDRMGVEGLRYDEAADRRSWSSALQLLQERLAPQP